MLSLTPPNMKTPDESNRRGSLAMTSESVKTGKAQAKVDYYSMSQRKLETFNPGTHSQNQEAGLPLMSKFDFTGI